MNKTDSKEIENQFISTDKLAKSIENLSDEEIRLRPRLIKDVARIIRYKMRDIRKIVLM